MEHRLGFARQQVQSFNSVSSDTVEHLSGWSTYDVALPGRRVTTPERRSSSTDDGIRLRRSVLRRESPLPQGSRLRGRPFSLPGAPDEHRDPRRRRREAHHAAGTADGGADEQGHRPVRPGRAAPAQVDARRSAGALSALHAVRADHLAARALLRRGASRPRSGLRRLGDPLHLQHPGAGLRPSGGPPVCRRGAVLRDRRRLRGQSPSHQAGGELAGEGHRCGRAPA